MVKAQYNGRLGNQLFQYTFGRLLAQRLGKSFVAHPIEGFEELIVGVREGYPDDPDRLIVNGYFENAHYYLEHWEEILKWFTRDYLKLDTCAVHIRGGDAAKEGFRCPPASYYREAIKRQNTNCTIYTDDPEDLVVKEIASEFGFDVVSRTYMEDFRSIAGSRSIITGNSTFAWWAAFLSGHHAVIQCLPTVGWRSQQRMNTCLINYRWTQLRYEPSH